MSKIIWKFPFVIKDEQEIELPDDYEFIHVGLQEHTPYLWAIVSSEILQFKDKCNTKVKIYVREIGQPLPDYRKHIGTFQDGQYVWHVFEGY